ncbi:22698_t:CDS:2, partial [Dentiscutata erythropus]
YAQQHINTLNAKINNKSIMGVTTRIRLQAAQNQLWIPNSILETNILKEQTIPYQNLTLDILILAKQYRIEWSTSTISSKITTTLTGEVQPPEGNTSTSKALAVLFLKDQKTNK